ncbi:MAG TPA: ABC transporter ATP-binding protein [Candidatus Limnocylindrales bacterium]|nr:ABC transporter ATP-binding protein [Candidatus Limnocylindrales bacterium]
MSTHKLPSISSFISYIGRFKLPFIFTALGFALADVCIAIIPWLIGQFTSSITGQNGTVTLWLSAVIGASVLHHILWFSAEYLFYRHLTEPTRRFDDVVFTEVMQKDYAYFTDRFTGKISSYVTTLGREFRDLMDSFMHSYISLMVTLPIIAATMFTVNLTTGLIFILSLALMLAGGKPLAARAAAAEKSVADTSSSVDGHIVDAIGNFVSVKAFGNEHVEVDLLQRKRGAVVAAAKKEYFRSILFWGYMGTIVRTVLWPATFIMNALLFANGDISLAQLTAFVAAIVIFQNYIWEVVWSVSQLNIKIARIEEAYRYLFGTRNIIKEPYGVDHSLHTSFTFGQTMELRNVSFAYPDKPSTSVLSDINLTIKKGEKIGIVGPSGGGKSTLVKLLLGYYHISEGKLLVDGKPTDNQRLTELIAYVPRDTAIFHRSIRDNIAYARPDATDAEVRQAAQHAQAEAFIFELDKGYATLVGERGVKLSGGQRQRIAIARALLKDAPLLLLDEATSALDSESEQLVQAALADLLRRRTAIVIAHRLSTIQKMDRIIVMEHGQIVEQGSHAELLATRGLYHKLWQHQSGGFIEE